MKNVTLTFKTTKTGYTQFTSPDVRGIVYFSNAAFLEGKTPTTLTVSFPDNVLAAPPASKVVDPKVLAAEAEKAAQRAAKTQARADALAKQLAALTGSAKPKTVRKPRLVKPTVSETVTEQPQPQA